MGRCGRMESHFRGKSIQLSSEIVPSGDHANVPLAA
jgi:hypothetical protein